MATLVKICGVRDPAGMRACVEARVDLVGLNFAPRSRRRIEPDIARDLAATLPDDGPETVGVFADQRAGDVMRIARHVGLPWVQLHGDEPPGYCAAIGGATRLIKAFTAEQVRAGTHRDYAGLIDMALVDGRVAGSGQPWDFAAIADNEFEVPVLVAGGLDPDNVADALLASRADGADVASGVETKGEQDPERIAAFVAAVRKAEASR